MSSNSIAEVGHCLAGLPTPKLAEKSGKEVHLFEDWHQDALRLPEDVIRFAGEHKAHRTGSLEGALESAERVTKELETLAQIY